MLKKLAWLIGCLAVITWATAVVGRFHGPSSVWLLGEQFQAATVLSAGNSLMLLALFLVGCSCCNKD